MAPSSAGLSGPLTRVRDQTGALACFLSFTLDADLSALKSRGADGNGWLLIISAELTQLSFLFFKLR